MKRPAILILVFLAGVFLVGFEPSTFAQTAYTAQQHCADGKDKIVVANSNRTNAFASGQNAVGVIIFEFSLEYLVCKEKSPKIIETKELILSVAGANLLEIEDFARIYVKDENGKVYPARIEKTSNVFDWRVVADLGTRLESQKARKFRVFADLPKMKPGASFNITFHTGKMSHFMTADGKTLVASDQTGMAVAHFNGNRPPKLYWTDYSQGVKSAVSPFSGLSGEQFEFRIKYGDEDNEAPKAAQVWVDLNGDGKYQANEKFNMAMVNSDQKNFSQGDGVEYFRTFRIVVKKPQTVKFRFYFTDSKLEAESSVRVVNEYSSEAARQKPTDEYSFTIGTPVAFGSVQLTGDKFVKGEPVKIVLPVFYLYRDLEVDWASIARNNFGPFKLLRWQLGRRGIASPEYKLPAENFDFQEIILFLGTSGIKTSAVNFPALKISYGIKDAKGQFKTQSEKLAFQNVKLRIENSVTNTLIRVGDQFVYSLKIIRLPDYELADFKPQEMTFEPFETLKFAKQSDNRDLYIVDTYVWTLASYYAISDPIPLPSFEISWRKVAGKKNNVHKIESVMVEMVPILGKNDKVMSQWDTGARPWPPLATYLFSVLPIALGGAVLVAFFGFWAVRRLMVWLAIWQESNYRVFRANRRKALRLIKSLLGQLEGSLVELLNCVKVLIGLNFGLTSEAAQAMTASEIETLLSIRGNSKYQALKDRLTVKGTNLFVPKLLEKAILRDEAEVLYFEQVLLCVKAFLRKTKYNPPD
ncbi:hypothetical protein A3C78_01665 [Candidatus Azambacteria bacterium RIFCSPHIGHO2_02_FULL_45_18]|nr:MAG: hypothetical protein A3C78_01665 [Candidatus Azambacteria bacterium RIFCSPHIGHO2_02_FULL_45_18]